MLVEFITKEDLLEFKRSLIQEIKQLLTEKPRDKQLELLKGSQVRNLLSISPNTLQKLRVNKTLKYTKIGGVIYYRADEINALMERGRERL
jgi:hypothetical protein